MIDLVRPRRVRRRMAAQSKHARRTGTSAGRPHDRPKRAGLGRLPRARDNAAMDILLNGEPRTLAPAATVLDLLHLEGLAERRVAVEVNGQIVPRGRHPDHALAPGDRVEIVHALGGG